QMEQGNLPLTMRQPLDAARYAFLGSESILLGDHRSAIANYQAGTRIWREIVSEFPNQPICRRALAMSLYCYSTSLKDTDQDAAAIAALNEAKQVLRVTAAPGPFTDYADLLADLGQSFATRHRRTEALDAYRRAFEECRELADAEPANAYQLRMARY